MSFTTSGQFVSCRFSSKLIAMLSREQNIYKAKLDPRGETERPTERQGYPGMSSTKSIRQPGYSHLEMREKAMHTWLTRNTR